MSFIYLYWVLKILSITREQFNYKNLFKGYIIHKLPVKGYINTKMQETQSDTKDS